MVFFFKQKTAYEMRISDWSSDVCSSDLRRFAFQMRSHAQQRTDRDDTCAANARHHDVICAILQRNHRWGRQHDVGFTRQPRLFRLARLGIQHGDEAVAAALRATIEIGIASGGDSVCQYW